MKKIGLQRYSEYRNTDIDWLGSIPQHWIIKRIKEISLINDKTIGENTPSDCLIDYIEISSVEYGVKEYAKETIAFGEAPSRARRVVKQGDVIISTVRTYLKAVATIYEDNPNLIASTGFAVLSPYRKINSRFFSYYLSSEIFIDRIAALSKGVSYPAINAGVIANVLCIMPPQQEQVYISNFLDLKTDKIDKKIEMLVKKSEKFKELKLAIIKETVSMGVSKNNELKESGVEWIGKIPQNWEMKRGKDLFSQTKNRVGSESDLYDVLSLTLRGVIIRELDNMKGKIPASFDGYQIANPNNLVLCLFDMDVTPRIVGMVKQKGIITSAYTVLKGNNGVNMNYYLYYFLEQNRNKSLLANSKTLRSTMTFDLFAQLPLPVPPIDEQQQIAEYLDLKTSQIDNIIYSINLQIEKLKELRKTLINDVVTGKIRVIEDGDLS